MLSTFACRLGGYVFVSHIQPYSSRLQDEYSLNWIPGKMLLSKRAGMILITLKSIDNWAANVCAWLSCYFEMNKFQTVSNFIFNILYV